MSQQLRNEYIVRLSKEIKGVECINSSTRTTNQELVLLINKLGYQTRKQIIDAARWIAEQKRTHRVVSVLLSLSQVESGLKITLYNKFMIRRSNIFKVKLHTATLVNPQY